MEARGQFTLYASIYESAKRIKNKSARADFYDAVCAYALNGIEPDLDKLSDAAAIGFISARPNLDSSRKKASNGKQGGSKPKANRKQTESEKEKEREKENENENENEIEYECKKAQDFESFWEAYPRKVGKTKAEAAFQKLSVPVDVLLSAIAKQKKSAQWTKDGGQFIPHPTTWLNRNGWEDELAPANNIPKGASGELGEAELDAIARIMGI